MINSIQMAAHYYILNDRLYICTMPYYIIAYLKLKLKNKNISNILCILKIKILVFHSLSLKVFCGDLSNGVRVGNQNS
jgi:hypothetical protein